MASCKQCTQFIVIGGKKELGNRFCSKKCLEIWRVNDRLVSPAEVDLEAERVFNGSCPVCEGRGPVDLHESSWLVSAGVISYGKTEPRISCSSCATRANLKHSAICWIVGWWSIIGIFAAPLFLMKNFSNLYKHRNASGASEKLKLYLKERMTAERLANPGAHSHHPAAFPAGQAPGLARERAL